MAKPTASIKIARVVARRTVGRMPVLSTPILLALQRAEAYFLSYTAPRPRFVLLASDGLPTCMMSSDEVRAQIQRLRDRFGIETFVLGIAGATTSDTVLDGWAVAGGRPRTGTRRYYRVADAAEFETAVRTIVSSTCRASTRSAARLQIRRG